MIVNALLIILLYIYGKKIVSGKKLIQILFLHREMTKFKKTYVRFYFKVLTNGYSFLT